MPRSLPAVWLVLFLGVWLAASYGVRYGLMEDGQWVGLCTAPAAYWQCEVRSLLGLGIHYQVLAWGGLAVALLAQVVAGRGGWWLAVLVLVFAVPALVLYTASIAVFALVLAGLRLVRQP
jgi:glucan phosphoethanolaminetransferase (alkaline phosphatase superfamily)